LQSVVSEIERHGAAAAAVVCDVTDDEQIAAAVHAVAERFGRLDLALANAGFSVAGRVIDLSGDDWRRQLDTNVVGAALTVRHALPLLRETGGRVGLVGSVAGFLCQPKLGAYSASKFAVRALGETLSIELHGSGVSCTTIHPGYVASEIVQVDNSGQFDPTRRDRRPQRLIWPAERAAMVIVRALHRRKRELVFTGAGKLGAFVGRHFPAMAHAVFTRTRTH